jgi:ubiquinone/menaquinone biosynthesis C-methylase UbiE
MQEEKDILDLTCDGRMMWFDKHHPNVLFADIRVEEHTLCDKRRLTFAPDVIADFRELPFENERFKLVVFDPCFMFKRYSALSFDWRTHIRQGFHECMRVLQPRGVLILKWNGTQVHFSEVLNAIPYKPLFGHTSGDLGETKWMNFIK